ncbi:MULTISPECIES: indolepyruvate ferredoxin oxidoreductase subunit alpha [unclassified Desulfovibrio]|uniref:indolepyruvate ferredoxin oxidoreductase subunit alpha n=1 Tax=unclassified Desulfovibrio TaxID=2593640 RepID=UPI0013EA8194|nr:MULTISPECIES: indolepyruvate ferredoxin oxidoreductase subunit alpha [unclassified Desulfovibrio]
MRRPETAVEPLLRDAPGERHLLLGNEAIVRGALEAGVHLVTCYPGTPSSEVPDTFSRLREQILAAGDMPGFGVEYATNEKVALEVGAGAALGGAQCLVTMKHVGLNVAADPLFTAAYVGLPGGLVLLSADDPGCHSSQNEQDNRSYARAAHVPCFEPASAGEARDMTVAAFRLARELEQPVMLRTTTRVSHLRGPVTLGPLPESVEHAPMKREPTRYVPVPAVALRRHRALDAQMEAARAVAETSPFNTVRAAAAGVKGPRRGIIVSGPARNYLADALHADGLEGATAVLELGMTWPLPEELITAFLADCDEVLVLEEGADLLERDARALAQERGLGVSIAGKDDGLTGFGEFSLDLVRRRLARWFGLPEPKTPAGARGADCGCEPLPGRPPNLCPGCAHRAVYYAARKAFGDAAIYSSDIGCYTLGLLPPLRTADFLVCMGSSISAGSGYARATGAPVVGFIGDSTFFHSGMTGLANAVFNRHDILVVILDNGTTAMTGHQPNPGMAQHVLGEHAAHLDIEPIVRALGVEEVRKVRGSNLAALKAAFEELGALSGVRVLIAEEPCVLYARRKLGKGKPRVAEVVRQGAEALRCLEELACPAFCRNGDEVSVDESLCTGCMICLQAAPGVFRARNRA